MPRVWGLPGMKPYARRKVTSRDENRPSDFIKYSGREILEAALKGESDAAKISFALTFLTGGRASEVLSLRLDQFEYKVTEKGTSYLMVNNMVVKKRRRNYTRTFPIRLDDPLAGYLERILQYSKYDMDAGENKDGRIVDLPKSYSVYWKHISLIGGEPRKIKNGIVVPQVNGPWWPHRLRAERATQLVVERGYGVIDLMAWFGWKSSEMPTEYVRMTGAELIKVMFSDE